MTKELKTSLFTGTFLVLSYFLLSYDFSMLLIGLTVLGLLYLFFLILRQLIHKNWLTGVAYLALAALLTFGVSILFLFYMNMRGGTSI